jgi:hypothetical protein
MKSSNDSRPAPVVAQAVVEAIDDEAQPDLRIAQLEAMVLLDAAEQQDRRLSLIVRSLLGVFALSVLGLAAAYAWIRGDEMVDILQQPRAEGQILGERLLALTAPVLLLVLLGALAAGAAFVIHSRGAEQTYRTIDAINRIRREGEVAVSARGLTHAFEEKLQNASKAFSVLLWFGRTLFIVCLGLFTVAVLETIASGVDLFTVTLGAASIGGAILAVVTGLPEKLSHQLADVLQLQAIVTGCDRQISLLESHAFSVLNRKQTAQDGGRGRGFEDFRAIDEEVLLIQQRMDDVTGSSVARIEKYVENTKKTSETPDSS